MSLHPNHRLFGEWLVPHTLKTYREEAWRRFYVFDITVPTAEGFDYIPYEVYVPWLEECELDYAPLQVIITTGNYESFIAELEKNTFMVEDGKGAGEGIVLKNYGFRNRFGRITWAKIVRNEFVEKHGREMGTRNPVGGELVEAKMAEEVSSELIDKVYANIKTEMQGWQSRYIPRLLETVFHDFIVEDTWRMLKKYKLPSVSYKTLKALVIARIKEIKPEVFS
jgi:hypothetical protein